MTPRLLAASLSVLALCLSGAATAGHAAEAAQTPRADHGRRR